MPPPTAEQIAGLFIIAFLVVMYFVPTILAKSQRRRQVPAIFALNLLLGWTVLGWIAALIWALTKDD